MLHVELRFEDGTEHATRWSLPLTIGRDRDCDLALRGWRVGRRHARLQWRGGEAYIEDFGALAGTWVNGRRVSHYGPLRPDDEIVIGPCLIVIRQLCADEASELSSVSAAVVHAGESVLSAAGAPTACEPAMPFNDSAALPAAEPGMPEAVLAVTGDGGAASHLQRRRHLHTSLIQALDLRRRDITRMTDDGLREEARQLLDGLLDQEGIAAHDATRARLLTDVIDEAIGLGPLEPLLADAGITEIMVNRHDEIFIERDGLLQRTERSFSSEAAVLGVIERIVSPIGRRIDESSPMVDARLRDGSRVNAVIAPVALRGASLTIRKFPQRRLAMADLLDCGALGPSMARFLATCVRERRNIVVAGGTGSGKTTLLNVLSNCIPARERIVTIEDAAELRLNHEHLVSLEARPANAEGQGHIAIRDLVRNALRMRPDRIVVGECRGAEAFDMLAAMNTGHEGSLTTLHANTPRDALARLETMILMAGMDLPLGAVREHIASSIHFIVQQSRLSCGRRLVTSILEVTGLESGRLQTQPVFRYQPLPLPQFQGCGVIPDCFADTPLADDFPAGFFESCEPASAATVGFRPGEGVQ